MLIEPITSLPNAARRPALRGIIEKMSALYGVPVHNIVGRNKRQFRAATNARHELIIAVYGKTFGRARSYGLVETARALGLDHSTVFYHLRKASLK